MADVAFHFNVPDKLAYACRLLRKAQRQGARVAVVAADDQLDQMDRMLWDLDPSDFVVHCREHASEEVRALTSILLTTDARGCSHREVLVNLGAAVPDGFAEFAKVVEVVSQDDEADRADARERWRAYADGGHPIVRYDLATKKAGG